MEILHQLSRQRGYFLRREALRLGLDDRALHAAVRRGATVRIRQGAYCHADVWRALTDEGRFMARSMAAYDLSVSDVALSHTSALAHYGCPLWSVALDRVHLTHRDGGTSRTEAHTVHHARGRLDTDQFVLRDDSWVTAPAVATVGAMAMVKMESAVVAGDWMIQNKLTTKRELWAMKMRLNRHPLSRHLEVAVRLLDGRSQSPGESRCRFLFWLAGLPVPSLQYEVRDATGRLIAVCDFAWPAYGVYGEFDGRVKYGRLLKPGQDPGDVVFEEKRREDAIRRETRGTVVRWTWNEINPYAAPTRQLIDLLRKTA